MTRNTSQAMPDSPLCLPNSRLARWPSAWRIGAALILLLSVTCSGCGRRGDGPERVVVSGKATYLGQPISQGLIYFVPKSGNVAPTTIAKINNGQYTSNEKGGIPVGAHQVKVFAYDKESEEGIGGLVPRQYLPPRYNTKSKLEVSISSEDSPVTYDLELGKD